MLRRFSLLDSRFVLYVGGISPHKNLGTLLDAFARLRRDPTCSDCRLVLVGDYSGDVFYSAYDELRQKTKLLGLGEAVHFTGYVADEDLVHLYSAAEVFVLPSLLEGFGLPVIEAMACGAPVVASRRGALPEVVGSAGLLFDPDRPGDLYDVLRRVLTDHGAARSPAASWTTARRRVLLGSGGANKHWPPSAAWPTGSC